TTIFRTLLTALILLAGTVAHAHKPNQSYVFIDVLDDRVDGRVEITMGDLNDVLGTTLPDDGTATLDDIRDSIPQIQAYVLEHAAMGINGGPMSMPFTDFGITALPLGQYVSLRFAFENLETPPETIELRYDGIMHARSTHRSFMVIENNWKTGTFNDEGNIALSFEPGSGTLSADLSDNSTLGGFMAMVEMGTHHIWIGIDHILFLLALLIPSVVRRVDGRWQPVESFRDALIYVLKIVTVFTIAHTITLSLAALGKVSLSPRIVESIIALSIAVAALDILVPIFKGRIWLIVFGFGLFHGFGFASILGGIGIPPRYMVHSLLGFNVGVELGQVVIVCLLFPLLYVLRRSNFYIKGVLRAGAIALIVVSLYWFIERGFEIDLPAGAIVNAILGR
ncbi:MAG: HupE/UreJ family protein, partial [Pseudomonadota bacterium]